MTNTLKIYGYRCPADDDVMPTDLAQECQNDEGFAYTDPLVRLKDVRELVQKGGSRVAAGWQPIETAPKDGTEIIVFHKEGGVCAAFCPGEGFAWHCMDGSNTGVSRKSGVSIPVMASFVEPPTHWMPLPESSTP